MNQWQIGAKVYPFAGALFLGVGFGKQTFTGSQIQTVQSVSTEIKLVADATVIVPQLGWRWVGDSGFFFGMEFGWQFVLETSSTFSDSTNNAAIKTDATYLSTKAEIEDKANSLLKKGLPQFALLQVGFFF
jgi:hypothetical protein